MKREHSESQTIALPIDTARATFTLDATTVTTDQEFREIVTAFYVHVLLACSPKADPGVMRVHWPPAWGRKDSTMKRKRHSPEQIDLPPVYVPVVMRVPGAICPFSSPLEGRKPGVRVLFHPSSIIHQEPSAHNTETWGFRRVTHALLDMGHAMINAREGVAPANQVAGAMVTAWLRWSVVVVRCRV